MVIRRPSHDQLTAEELLASIESLDRVFTFEIIGRAYATGAAAQTIEEAGTVDFTELPPGYGIKILGAKVQARPVADLQILLSSATRNYRSAGYVAYTDEIPAQGEYSFTERPSTIIAWGYRTAHAAAGEHYDILNREVSEGMGHGVIAPLNQLIYAFSCTVTSEAGATMDVLTIVTIYYKIVKLTPEQTDQRIWSESQAPPA